MHSTWQLENGWIVSFFLPFSFLNGWMALHCLQDQFPALDFHLWLPTSLAMVFLWVDKQIIFGCIWRAPWKIVSLTFFPFPPTLSQHQIQTNPKSLSISIENVLQVKKTTLPIRLFLKTKAQFNPIQAWLFWMFSFFFYISVHRAFY